MNRQPQPPTAARRRWYQFSLRTLVLVVVAVSALLGLFGARLQRARRQAKAVALIRENGGNVDYDYTWRRTQDGALAHTLSTQSPLPRWLLLIFGEDFFHDVLKADVQFANARSQADFDNVVKAVGELHKLEEFHFFDLGFDGVPSVAPLRQLRNVRNLDLSLGRLTSHDFEVFESMAQLERLTLFRQRVDCEAAKHLAKLSQLSDLTIGYMNEVDDDAVRQLVTLPRLESLSLDDTQITDDALAVISRMETLQRLSLSATAVTDRGVAFLGEMSQLEDLDLADSKVTGVGIRWPVALTTVRLSRSSLTDAGLESLCRCRAISGLQLGQTQISDSGTRHLASLENLQWLELDWTKITDASLAVIGRSSGLKHLTLNGTNITDDGTAHLEGLQKLERLELAGTKVTCQRFSWPATLVTVNLSHTELTDEALMRLAKCARLECVLVDKTRVTDDGLAEFEKLRPDVDLIGPLPFAFIGLR